jgi:hypothetical protein
MTQCTITDDTGRGLAMVDETSVRVATQTGRGKFENVKCSKNITTIVARVVEYGPKERRSDRLRWNKGMKLSESKRIDN